MNNFIGIGRSATEVELKYTTGGLAIASFTIALDKGYSKDKKQEEQTKGNQTADFIKVTAFNKTAEFIANYLGKGKQVAVNGRIQTGNYMDKDNKKVYTTEIIANSIEVLEWANKETSGIEGFNNVDMADMGDIPF